MKKIVDLRSDTVTRPSGAMREAMMQAEVGDDVYREDPAINELQDYAASLFGVEEALFCPSGTMTNQIAVKLHTRPGDEVICDVNAHIFNYETGGLAFNSGVQARLVKGDEGRLSAAGIEPHINAELDWLARTALVSLENTVNRAGGSYYTLQQMQSVSDFCHERKLRIHLDGARIFNALAETGTDPKEIGPLFDTISICLSKGLGAPVGSLLLGSTAFIREARRIRKVLGGGMRQAGIIAAAGLFALKNNVKRLSEDHRRARVLGEALSSLPCVEKVNTVYTNIVIFELKHTMPSEKFEKLLASCNIRIAPFGKQTVRMVTHLDFDDAMLDYTINKLKAIAESV